MAVMNSELDLTSGKIKRRGLFVDFMAQTGFIFTDSEGVVILSCGRTAAPVALRLSISDSGQLLKEQLGRI